MNINENVPEKFNWVKWLFIPFLILLGIGVWYSETVPVKDVEIPPTTESEPSKEEDTVPTTVTIPLSSEYNTNKFTIKFTKYKNERLYATITNKTDGTIWFSFTEGGELNGKKFNGSTFDIFSVAANESKSSFFPLPNAIIEELNANGIEVFKGVVMVQELDKIDGTYNVEVEIK